jgi:hypothetical protein
MSDNAARVAMDDQLGAAMDDQLGAAYRDAQGMLNDFAALLGTRHTVDHTKPGPFARQLVEGLGERMSRHRQRTCSHLRRSPQVSWLFGWLPERLLCERCAHRLLARAVGTLEDLTCDVCRSVAGGVNPVMGAAGPMIVLFGACDPCYSREMGAAA